MSATLRELLDGGRVHVFDGAMGTALYAKGVFVNVCYDEINITRPKIVREVHEQYLQAGAEILETNTFGANPTKLLDGIDGARELDQHTIAGGLEDAAVVLGCAGVEDLFAKRLELRQRPGLVRAHEPGIADHVGSKDRC